MAYPTKPQIQTSYTAVEQALGDGTLPGQELDNDLDNLKTAVDELNDFVRGVTRSDGRLANQSVSVETLGPDILLGFDAPDTWEPGRTYAPPQTVFESDAFYLCVIEHESGVDFTADLAAGRWELLVDFASVLDDSLAALAEFKARYLGAAASDPVTDLAGEALVDGAAYWNTVDRRLKVYDLGTAAWYFVSPTPAEQTAINTVAAISGDVTTVSGISGDVTAAVGNAADISTVAGISADVTIAAANVADITNFADVYQGPAAADPTLRNDGSALQAGDLYFNTAVDEFRVYDGAAWRSVVFGAVPQTSTTGAAEIPTGTEAQRDGTPAAGYFRFNTDTGQFEGFNGTAWGSVGGGATGSGGDQIFIQNGQVVTQDYTIPADQNAMSTGPVTIDDGVTVTVSTGSRYVVI